VKDLDTPELRAIVVLGGLIGLFIMLLLYSFAGVEPNSEFVRVFGAMVALPFGASVIEKVGERRNRPPDPPQQDEAPPSPPKRPPNVDYMLALA
jgi:hypothetical protein